MYGRVLLSAGKKPYIALKPLPQESVVDTLRTAMEIMERRAGEPKRQKQNNPFV